MGLSCPSVAPVGEGCLCDGTRLGDSGRYRGRGVGWIRRRQWMSGLKPGPASRYPAASPGGRMVALPDVLEGFGEGLEAGSAVDVAGVLGEDELVLIALGSEGASHVFVGQDPVVHVVAHDVGVEEIEIADLHPDADGLARRIGDEVLRELPGAVRGFRVVRPLLVDPCA